MEELRHPHCKYFQTEDNHIPDQGIQEFWAKGEPATGHYWCLQTMTISGPDALPVDPEDCHEGRECFFRK